MPSATAGSTDLSQLRKLEAARRRQQLSRGFRKAKREAKVQFADWLKSTSGQTVDPDTIFDCQIKRIHEYKRQLLNALRIVVLYNRLRENPDLDDGRRARSSSPARRRRRTTSPSSSSSSSTISRQRIDGDPVVARAAQSRLPARLLRFAGRAADSGQRCFQPDLDRRLRGQRHQQHEVHDERRSDHRHPRRRDHRDGRRGRRGEFLPVWPDGRASRRKPRLVQPALALRERAGNPRRAGSDLRGPLQPRRARHLRSRSSTCC